MGKKIEKKEPRPIFDRAQIFFLDLNSAIVFIRLIYPVVRFLFKTAYFNNSGESITELGSISEIFSLSKISRPKKA